MAPHLGNVPASSTLYIPFETVNGSGLGVTITGLAVTDIEVYKNGSTTQRSSDNGYALLDTDGIDFDGVTGLHGISIDLSDNSDSGFYAAGAQYWVLINAVTLLGAAITPLVATFRIVAAESVAGKPKVDVDAWAGTATTLTSGLPDVNMKTITGGIIAAASFAANALDAVWSTATRVLTAGTNIQLPSNGLANVTAWTVALTGNITGNLSGSVSSVTGLTASDVGAIKTKTDSLTFTVGGMVDSNVVDWKGATAPAMTGDAFARIGSAGAGLTALGDTRIANLDAAVSTRSTYAGGDTAGTTTLLSRLSATRAGYLDNLSAGAVATAASITALPQAVWDALTSALTTVGSIGKLLVTNIDAAITSRLAGGAYTAPDNASITAVKERTDHLPDDPADQSLVIAATNAIMTRLGTPADTDIATDIANISGGGSAPTVDEIADEVQSRTNNANIVSVNSVPITGGGIETTDEWRPA